MNLRPAREELEEQLAHEADLARQKFMEARRVYLMASPSKPHLSGIAPADSNFLHRNLPAAAHDLHEAASAYRLAIERLNDVVIRHRPPRNA
jgi:hypothetical protein